MIDREDGTEILAWIGTAFLVLGLVNALMPLVPLQKPAKPEYAMHTRRP